jgi:hypothetical protein
MEFFHGVNGHGSSESYTRFLTSYTIYQYMSWVYKLKKLRLDYQSAAGTLSSDEQKVNTFF